MRSLQFRLGAGLLFSLLIVFLVLWLVVSSAIRELAQDHLATRLLHDSETLLAALSFNADSQMIIDNNRIDSIYQRPVSGHYYQIHSDRNVLRSRSLWDTVLAVPQQRSGQSRSIRVTGPQQQPLLVVVSGYTKNEQALTIAVAEDLSAIEADIHDFQLRFGMVALGLLLLLGIANLVMVRTGLSPLKRVRDEVRELESGGVRKLNDRVPQEIAPLVREINHLLQVMNARLQRSRHSLGDLAHALKKPLTVLRQMQRDATPPLQQELETQTTAMQQIIDHVLRRARLAGDGHAGSGFEVSRDIPALVDALKKMYQHKSLEIEFKAPEKLHLAADREDMLELVGNLLDNACKWANQGVRLQFHANAELSITVEDDGPGIDAAQIRQLGERGKRLDETVEGHGLGLAIVHDIVTQYGGTIVFDQSEKLGGLRVRVTLPGQGTDES